MRAGKRAGEGVPGRAQHVSDAEQQYKYAGVVLCCTVQIVSVDISKMNKEDATFQVRAKEGKRGT